MSAWTIDVYPVGLLRDIRHKQVRYGLRYVAGRANRGDWRAVRNYFNGYLAEPENWPADAHRFRCGRGWTERAALRRLHRNLRPVSR